MPALLENSVKFIITVGVGVCLGTHVCGTVNNFVFGVCVGEGFLYSPDCPEASYIDQDDLTFQGLCHHPQPVGSFGSPFSLSMFTWVLEIRLRLLLLLNHLVSQPLFLCLF